MTSGQHVSGMPEGTCLVNSRNCWVLEPGLRHNQMVLQKHPDKEVLALVMHCNELDALSIMRTAFLTRSQQFHADRAKDLVLGPSHDVDCLLQPAIPQVACSTQQSMFSNTKLLAKTTHGSAYTTSFEWKHLRNFA